jgi:hypothetical protein
MQWLDPKTHPIPENIPCIAYRVTHNIDDDPVIVVRSTTFDKNEYTNLTYEEGLEHLGIEDIKAWMFLPKPPCEDKFSCPKFPDNS